MDQLQLQTGEFVGALDCGTTSVRFIVFDKEANIIALDQIEFEQFYPHPGWHEQDPEEILDVIDKCITRAISNLEGKGWKKESIKVIGITNQRETTVAWDKTTGKSLCRAIVWDDSRTKSIVTTFESKLREEGIKLSDGTIQKGENAILKLSGLPLSTYFSAMKLRWMIDHYQQVQIAHDQDNLLFGTIDSWIVYNLTDKLHITDPTNASRTLLLNITTLTWSSSLLTFFSLRPSILPRILSSSEPYAKLHSTALKGIEIAGIIGDQQAALVGNKCLKQSQAKCTFGTGAFLLFCTGQKVVTSSHGLISTVAYQPGPNSKPVYALEGSIAIAGSAIKWLRDQLHLISSSSEINDLASQEPDSGGIYFVPAFSGLLAPYWDSAASGLIIGLSSYTNKSHIARATLEATAFQTRAIIESMHLDHHSAKSDESTDDEDEDEDEDKVYLKVDGGMTNGDLAMQILADLTGRNIIRPEMRESTALGAAILAGSAIKLFGWDINDPKTLEHVNERGTRVFKPRIEKGECEIRWKSWKRAVERSRGWLLDDDSEDL